MGLEDEFSIYVDDNISFCVEITENFAIGFKKWCDECHLYNMENFTNNDLLEIYKKTL